MSDNLADVKAHVTNELRIKNGSTKLWSLAYHGTLFGSACLSFVAAVVLQAGIVPDEKLAKGLATVATLTSGLFTTVMGTGRFQEKWQTSRLAKGRLEIVRLSLMEPTPDTTALLEELKSIRRDHDLGIVGSLKGSPPGDKTIGN